MTTLQILGGDAYGNAQTKLQVLGGLSQNVGSATSLRILNGVSVNTNPNTTLRVLNGSAVNVGAAVAAMSGPAVVNTKDLVTLDASASVGTITSITQTAGTPTVTLSGSGSFRTFEAPIIFSPGGLVTNLTFRCTVSGGGTDDVTVAVNPHSEWVAPASSSDPWIPRLRYGRDPATQVPGGVAGWGPQVAKIDFTTPVAVGGFVPDGSGNLTNLQGGAAGYLAYKDVLNVSAGAPQVLSVNSDGNLDIWVHRVNNAPVVATIKPSIPAMTYGRYAFRYKVVSAGLGTAPLGTSPLGVQPSSGWSCIIGLLPADGLLPDHGQVDAAAGDISNDVLVYNTPAVAAGVRAGVSTATPWTDWHIGVIELKPGSLKVIHDDVTVLNTTANVPNTPMVFSIRPSGNSASGAHILIDYIAAWQV